MSIEESDGLVPSKFHLVACLVTDKKYRKMGGDEGLSSAIRKRMDTVKCSDAVVMVKQICVEELMETDDFDGNFWKVIKKSFGVAYNNERCFVTLIHKYTDFYKISGKGSQRVKQLRDWLCVPKPQVRVLDDPKKIEVLSSRVQTGDLIREMCEREGFEWKGLQWPEFHVKSMGNLDFPVILKPIDACSTDESHWMTLLTEGSVEGFKGFKGFKGEEGEEGEEGEVLVQKYYEHFGVLYKVYVIGDDIEIFARPSISTKDLGPIFRFNTHKFKSISGELGTTEKDSAMKRIEPFYELITAFTHRLKSLLDLTWFGIDILIPEASNCSSGLRVAVIDVNYMPGFDGVGDLSGKLIKAAI